MARKWIFICFLVVGTLKGFNTTSTTNMVQGKTDDTKDQNLTAITWAHAVNSQTELDSVLNGTVEMIEADIVLGTLINDTSGKVMPVMGHPPITISDISLDDFLKQILEYNLKHPNATKGIKLDFKSTAVFNGSLDILNDRIPNITYPIWLNADILPGPVNATDTKPVDPGDFFTGCKKFSNAVLSIGWTTKWGKNYTEGAYSDNYTKEMLAVIKKYAEQNGKQKITFPVRAGIAANSLQQLENLVKDVGDADRATLTIWSSKGDYVNIEKLRNLIFKFGLDKVYVDVPEEVSSQLNLGNTPKTTNSASSSLLKVSILTIGLLITGILLQHTL